MSSIPKIIHIYENSEDMPEYAQRASILHPEWEIRVWNSFDSFEAVNCQLVNENLHDRHMLALMKIEILCYYGGVWLGDSIMLSKPLDSLLENTDHVLLETKRQNIDPDFLAFKPNHRILWQYLWKIQPRYFGSQDEEWAFDYRFLREMADDFIRYPLILPTGCFSDNDDVSSMTCFGQRIIREQYT